MLGPAQGRLGVPPVPRLRAEQALREPPQPRLQVAFPALLRMPLLRLVVLLVLRLSLLWLLSLALSLLPAARPSTFQSARAVATGRQGPDLPAATGRNRRSPPL